jgi:hypothetical protein
MGTTPLPGEASYQSSPASGHKPGWESSEGLHARPTSPKVTRQPPPGEKADGLGCPPAQA